MELYLIRHWKTKGNLEKRYICITDESILSGKEREEWVKKMRSLLPEADCVVTSPMKRCIESAELLYPGKKTEACDALRECDFGQFENHNYEELKTRPEYRKWMESGGMEAFPGGESREVFCRRCVKGFLSKIKELQERQIQSAAFVVHGGTIMAILEWLDREERSFYEWQAENGTAFYVRVEEDDLKSEKQNDESSFLRGKSKEIRQL